MPVRYHKGRFLGKGGFAKCYEVRDMQTNEIFAAKIVVKASISKPRAHAKLRSEISIHRSLEHDKVVQFVDYFEDSENVYIILELCPNQTLNEFVKRRPNKRLSEAETQFYIYDLIIGLKYLHRRRVIHRDLKLGNLFLDRDMGIKVADFGLAAQLEHDGEKKRTICGTPNYIAPEILEGKHGHSYEVDIWSLGVILYTMVFGRPPFETSDVKTTYRRIRYNQYSFPDTVRASEPVKELISSILRTDPRSRPGLESILAASWFQGYRIPPPMPVTIAAYTTPRSCGGSSARSDTPERGVVDFARIDSPAPRFPLSDRSPSVTPLGHGPIANNNNAQAHAEGNLSHRTGLLPGKHATSMTPCGSVTPGRAPLSGRPPLAQRCGNDENLMPVNTDTYAYGGSSGGNSPAACQAILGSVPTPCRSFTPPQTSLSSFGRPGSAARLSGSQGPQANSMPPQAGVVRSTTGSPRQALVPSRSTGATSTPRDGRSSPHGVCSASTENAHVTKATPVLRTTTPMALSARKLGENGPQLASTSTGSFTGQTVPVAVAQPMTPVPTRTPLATPMLAQAHDYSAHRTERSNSSPALVFDAPQRGALATATASLPVSGFAAGGIQAEVGRTSGGSSARLGTGLRSPMGGGTPLFETFREPSAPSASSTRCPSPNLLAEFNSSSASPELWVVKWVDYSSKYGVGYILSDGSIGVYFNDSTKILLLPDGRFDYVTRRTQEKIESRMTHTFDDYPEDLTKKVTLLRHFKNYMLTNVFEKKDGASVGESGIPAPQKVQSQPEPGRAPYVRKWTRNKHAIMFQLSNKIVQVIFFDKTEAVLSSRAHVVIYVDKKGQMSSYPLSSALDVPNPELAKRLRYIKDILVNLLGSRNTEPLAVQAH
jgi:serine/threonine protein kinase